MLKYGNRDFRNLQEQVYANMKNIEDIIKGSDITMDYKLNIVAQVAKATDLPDADTYEGKYGDIYIVGEAAPLDAYVFGKVYENENAPSWIELGEIFVEGPQGPKGETGDAAGFAEPTVSTSTLAAGSPATVSIVASGPDTAKEFAFTFGIPKGDKGDTGAQGPQGPQGEPGSGTSVSDFVEGTGIVISSAADAKVEIAVDESKVLVTPESAPATQQLVGINTSGEQNAINLGNQFDVVSNELISKIMYVVDWENATSTNRTDAALNAAMITDQYPLILVKNIGNTNYVKFKDVLFIRSGLGNNYMSYGVYNEISNGSGGDQLAPVIRMTNIILAPNGTTGAYLQLQAADSDPVRIIINRAGGTLSNSDKTRLLKGDFSNINLAIIKSGALDQISLKVESSNMLSSGNYHPYIYATGQYYDYTGTLVESYKVLINLETRAYTVTVTAAQ